MAISTTVGVLADYLMGGETFQGVRRAIQTLGSRREQVVHNTADQSDDSKGLEDRWKRVAHRAPPVGRRGSRVSGRQSNDCDVTRRWSASHSPDVGAHR